MNKLAGKFMKPGVIQAFKESGKSFDCFDPTFSTQLDDNELFIGLSTKLKLKQLVEDGYMDDNDCDFLMQLEVFIELLLSTVKMITS